MMRVSKFHPFWKNSKNCSMVSSHTLFLVNLRLSFGVPPWPNKMAWALAPAMVLRLQLKFFLRLPCEKSLAMIDKILRSSAYLRILAISLAASNRFLALVVVPSKDIRLLATEPLIFTLVVILAPCSLTLLADSSLVQFWYSFARVFK